MLALSFGSKKPFANTRHMPEKRFFWCVDL